MERIGRLGVVRCTIDRDHADGDEGKCDERGPIVEPLLDCGKHHGTIPACNGGWCAARVAGCGTPS